MAKKNPIVALANVQLQAPALTGDTLSVDFPALDLVLLADTETTRIEGSIYNDQTFVLTNYTPSENGNIFKGSIQLSETIDPTQVFLNARNYNPTPWQPRTSYRIGDRLADQNGYVWEAKAAGTSGDDFPTFPDPEVSTADVVDGNGTLLWKFIGEPKISATLKFALIYSPKANLLQIGPPSGVRIYKGQSSCKVEWMIPPYPNTRGVRVLLGTDASGVNAPFMQFGDLVNNITRSEDVVIDATTYPTEYDVDAGTRKTVTEERLLTVNYASVEIPYSYVGQDQFYVLLSTVVFDPNSNQQYESQQNGPFLGGFVNLRKVNPTDFLALQRKEDVAGRVISQITRVYPDLDLTPRSEVRDLWIDPFSLEAANMSVREWFARISQSVSALYQIDDADGDLVSDPLESSPVKQQLARAYGLSGDGVQALIDKQFDILGEQAGVERGGAVASVASVTFYTYQRPSQSVTFPEGTVLTTSPDANTPALNFITRGSATISPNDANSFYDPAKGWWSLTVPAECQTTGSVGNVGAGTIRQIVTSAPSSWNVTNLFSAKNGLDVMSNAKFAELISDALVAGKDTGTRPGYRKVASQTPGIIQAKVVAAGDLEMLRDWDPTPGRDRHIFGCVDIYARGASFSQQNDNFLYTLKNTDYLTLRVSPDLSVPKFYIEGYQQLPYPIFTTLSVRAFRGNSQFYFGTEKAQICPKDGTLILDPNELTYEIDTDEVNWAVKPHLVQGRTQKNIEALASLAGSLSSFSFQLLARYQSPMVHVPTYQPLLAVSGVVGPQTGTVDPQVTKLVRSKDFLLEGMSAKAGDQVNVDASASQPVTRTIRFTTNSLLLDYGLDVTVNSDGTIGDILSVRSQDLTRLYQNGVHYTIVPYSRYRAYAIQRIATPSDGSDPIPLDKPIIVAYKQFVVTEKLTAVTDELVYLESTISSPLQNLGFVKNTWLPESYGHSEISTDADLVAARVPHSARYIKVTFNDGVRDIVMVERQDYKLTVDPVSGAASIARIVPNGRIPDKGTVRVSYFYNEAFTISTQYPSFVQQLKNKIAETQHAGGDVLVKAMVENPVDVAMKIWLKPDAAPEVVDMRVRTAISIAMDNAKDKLTQAELVHQVKSVTGVANIAVPLTHLAKSNGAYDIGVIIPSSSDWTLLDNSKHLYVTAEAVLENNTLPSGGTADAYAGFLYEGEAYHRAKSWADLLSYQPQAKEGVFYIVGIGDTVPSGIQPGQVAIRVPAKYEDSLQIDPALRSYRVTYQVYNEDRVKDIPMSSTEYLTPGRVTINFVTTED